MGYSGPGCGDVRKDEILPTSSRPRAWGGLPWFVVHPKDKAVIFRYGGFPVAIDDLMEHRRSTLIS